MKRQIIRKTKFISLALALILSGCGHEHNFSDATCESPRICLECGETEGEKLSHNWLEATCESPKTCALCNITEGEPLEHQWLEATIENPKKCKLCGLTEGEPLPVEEPEVKEEQATKAEEEAYDAEVEQLKEELGEMSEEELSMILGILNKIDAETPQPQQRELTPEQQAYQDQFSVGSTKEEGVKFGSTEMPDYLKGGTME